MPCTEAGRKGGRASGIQAVKQVSSHRQQHWGPYIIAYQRQSTVHTGSDNIPWSWPTLIVPQPSAIRSVRILGNVSSTTSSLLGHDASSIARHIEWYKWLQDRSEISQNRYRKIDIGLRCRWGNTGPDKESDQHPSEQSEVAIPRYRKCNTKPVQHSPLV